jgi:hypothetical protein
MDVDHPVFEEAHCFNCHKLITHGIDVPVFDKKIKTGD